MASSSSSQIWEFDVFLSFRGETRKTFVSHLHKALVTRKIKTFKDDWNLVIGSEIATKLWNAISKSRLAVVVISPDYASSTWCLNELQLIMELVEKKELEVVPIFYGVEPSDVTDQRGKFDLKRYQNSDKANKVIGWREALTRIANRDGKDPTKCKDEAVMIEEIVRHISSRLLSKLPIDIGDVFGVEAHMEGLKPLLDMDSKNGEVRMIGIWGMGGTGKTTIAEYIFEEIKHHFSPHYCFIHNVRKNSTRDALLYLQKKLISTILHEEPVKLWSVERGAQIIKSRFSNLKVLIVLDDVNDGIQLSLFAKEARWFGPGSRIIITTRDKCLLTSCGVKLLYNVKCMDNDNSLKLFHHIAFEEEGGNHISQVQKDLSNRVSRLAQGLPLALKAFGLYLRGKSLEEWQDTLESFVGAPHEDIRSILRLSYDGLDELCKAIFLHVACLFNGDNERRVTSLLHCGRVGINDLKEKSLINISADGYIAMHVLVEEMGRKIVRQESGNRPAEQRILWDHDDIHSVLVDKIGTIKIEGITLDVWPYSFQIEWNDFQPMHNLKFLNIYKSTQGSKSKRKRDARNLQVPQKLRLLHWDGYPYATLPSTIIPDCLVELNLCNSKLKTLWSGTTRLFHLRRLDLTGSKDLQELPNLEEAMCLEELILKDCISLKQIPQSISGLSKLKRLDLSNCDGLKNITIVVGESNFNLIQGRSSCIRLVHLKFFDPPPNVELSHDNSLTHLSIEGGLRLELEHLGGSADHLCFISEKNIPDEMKMMEKKTPNLKSPPYVFKSLDIMRSNYNKKSNPFKCCSFADFPWMTELNLVNLHIKQVPDDIHQMQVLEKLDLSGNDFQKLPMSMIQLSKLKHVSLCNCHRLEALPELYQVETLTLSDCTNLRVLVSNHHARYSLLELWLDNCNNVESLSAQLSLLTELTYLDISRHNFETLPTSIKDLPSLVTLSLNYCKKLKSLTELPSSVKCLYAHGCKSLETSFISTVHSFDHLDRSPCFQREKNSSQVIRFPVGRRSEEVHVCTCFNNTKMLNTYIQTKRNVIPTLLKRLKPW